VVALDLTKANKLSVPLILFEGRHDRNVNSEVAATWFDTVKAPDKHLVWFEHSAHIPMNRGARKGPPFPGPLRPSDRGEGGRRSSVNSRFLLIQ
jgi:hypothetical protein